MRVCAILFSLFSLVCLAGAVYDVAVVDQRSEEFILGCELDGTIFAISAQSGDVRWRLEDPTKTYFRSSASIQDLNAALRNNESLRAPLFIPSLDGGLFFFSEKGDFQEIIMNPPFIAEDGSVLIGRKDTHIFVIELATGRVLDSIVTSDEEPEDSIPFGGHWPPGCVLLAASTYTVKGLHPLAPENKWSVVLTEFVPVLTSLYEHRPHPSPSRSSFLVTPGGDLYCVDEDSRIIWSLPWSAQISALYRIGFTASGSGRIVREELVLISEKATPTAVTYDHAPVYVGQLNGQLFAAPYKKAISGAQLKRPGVLLIGAGDLEPEPEVCLQNGSIVGVHMLPAPSSTPSTDSQLAVILPDHTLVLPAPATPVPEQYQLIATASQVPLALLALALACIGGAAYVYQRRRKQRHVAAEQARISSATPVTHAARPASEEKAEEEEAAETADTTPTNAKRKKKKKTAAAYNVAPATSPPVPTLPAPVATETPAALVPPGVKRVGKIDLMLDRILGYGSNGTVVYEGQFDGRKVAVKRLLRTMYDIASKEVTLFVESDEHRNVVRYFAKEEDGDFIYLALTFCVATLEDVVSPPPDKPLPLVPPGCDAPILQLAHGVQHLHALHIIHRDLKPANVLIDHHGVVRIADMGLARKMGPDEFSVSGGSLKSAMAGSLGWRPPEICRVHHATLAEVPSTAPPASKLHLSKKIDIFALGCIFYYVLTKGRHPFGQPFEREANILANKLRLDDPRCTYDAADLIRSMLHSEPKQRPNIEQVLRHPFFWDSPKKLLFFRDASDRVEVEKPNAPVVLALEARAPFVIGAGGWGARVDAEMLDNGGKYRKYNFASIRDLLRVIRNKSHHYRDLPEAVQARIGSLPDGFLAYFSTRFPSLMMEVHRVLQQFYPHEPALKQYM